jgi:hypothetical protein
MRSRRRRSKRSTRKRRRQRGGNSGPIVFTLTNSAGFGSVSHFLTQAFIEAKKNNKEFFIENSGWHYGNWNDYFKSLKVLDPSKDKDAKRYRHGNQIKNATLQDHVDAIKEIFVLKDDLMKVADDFKASIGSPYKAIYVRRGDKTSGDGKEMSAVDLPSLIKSTDIKEGDNLFVMTDDYAVVDELKTLLPGVKISTMTHPENKGSSIHILQKIDPESMKKHANELFSSMQVFMGATKGWAENRSNLGRFLKIAAPSTTVLYQDNANNVEVPMSNIVNPGFEYLRG